MKKGIIVSAIAGFASGLTVGLLSTSSKGSELRNKLLKTINTRFTHFEGKVKDLLSINDSNSVKDSKKTEEKVTK
ncbi:YtxH domain-containing protein [Fulvivirga lutea]|uniref:YtxH domain-containing protein n=1 Tax=Fulvivirga lutea TaxID=2810512 RepID=A0A974WEM7_9BACT|nr:YtxH domain-containing protein [Fulvivirga lutea]QSE96450.1 hypothetical protein JR347_12665 [Fulvivirga lutea]